MGRVFTSVQRNLFPMHADVQRNPSPMHATRSAPFVRAFEKALRRPYGAILSAMLVLAVVGLILFGSDTALAATGDFNHDLKLRGINYELPKENNCMLWDVNRTEEEIIADPHRILTDYSTGKVIIVAGGCSDAAEWGAEIGSQWPSPRNSAGTLRMVEQFQEAMKYPDFDDISLVVMDMEFGDRDHFTEEFLPYCSDKMRFVSSPSNENYIWYASWANSMFSELDPSYTLEPSSHLESISEYIDGLFKGWVTRPACFYLEDGRVKAVSTGDVNLIGWMCDAYGISLQHYLFELDLQGSFDTDAAYEARDQTGLTWDSDLERICMTLATEYAFSPDGNRPGIQSLSEMFMGRLEGSLLARTYASTKSDYPPDINVSGSATAVGSACFVRPDDTRFWVSITANPAGGGDGMRADVPMIASVWSLRDSINLSLESDATYWDNEITFGDTITLRPTVNNAWLRDYEVESWTSSDEGVATVSDGVVTTVGAGNVTITASLRDDEAFTGSFELVVLPYDFESWTSDAVMSLPKQSYPYTGSAIKPKPKVTCMGRTLKAGQDYDVTYSDNVGPGAACVTVMGKNSYKGELAEYFEIEEPEDKPIDIGNATISSIADQAYTGKAIKPAVTVKLGSTTLKLGTDYTVAYKDNTSVGNATVTVTGKGNYAGTKSTTFRIVGGGPASEIQEMHRLYNPNSGEHFYTASAQEKDALVSRHGWKYEGVGWVAPVKSNTPVYRLYNANAGDHHYTTNVKEKDALVKAGWKYEAIGWYSDDAKGTPLYRQYNPNAVAGSHNYTTSTRERDALVMKYGWHDEGIGWYGV